MMNAGEIPVRLLLVDDEPSILEPLADYLNGQGFDVTAVASAAKARSALLNARFDLVVSDVMMPGEDGLSLLRHIQSLGHSRGQTPVILLTARTEETERIIGLEVGADDYMGKPFSPRELVARIRTVLRRVGRSASMTAQAEGYRFGDWLLTPATRSLHDIDGREIDLSTGEYLLLEALVRHPRQVMSRDRLLDIVRGRDADVFDRAIDNLVSRLRKKIEADPAQARLVKTVWGGGYTLACDVVRVGSVG
jgi:two-component system OmpR family response regulator